MPRGNLIPLIGKKFGRWTVLGQAENSRTGYVQWMCRCACGTERDVKGASLREGISRSCGCLTREVASTHHLVDRIGQRYGRLTVVKRVKIKRTKPGEEIGRWLCKCDCGNMVTVLGYNLVHSTQSCGCLAPTPEEVAFNIVYRGYIGDAKKRKMEFKLTKDQFGHLVKQNCLYCGAAPREGGAKSKNAPYTYNGIDRVDNSQGYTLANCVPCCTVCNKAKGAGTLKEFLTYIVRAQKHIEPLLAPGFGERVVAAEAQAQRAGRHDLQLQRGLQA